VNSACYRAALAAAFALLLAVGAAPAAAQRFELVGAGEVELDRHIRQIQAAPDIVYITENRVFSPADTLRGTIIVLEASVRFENVIIGRLVGINASMFIRPGAVITDGVTNLLGGLYPSELAVIEGEIVNAPNAPYRLERDGLVWRLIGQDTRPRLALEGIRGFSLPTYDRVEALTLTAGAALLLPRVGRSEPRLRAQAQYRTRRQAPAGTLELRVDAPASHLSFGAQRATLTNDAWMRSTAVNTLTYFFFGNDYRDYYEADRAWAEAGRRLWTRDDFNAGVTLRVQAERARTLEAGNPWTLFGADTIRPNRPVNDGDIFSGILGADATWTGPTVVARGGGGLEIAPRGVGGDFDFGRYEVWADWAMLALFGHTLEIDARLQGPLPGTAMLPAQRWTMIGGATTLPTFEIGEFHGDRLAFVQTLYSVPLPFLRLPFIRPTLLQFMHAAGMAWTQEERRDLEQNVGVRLQLPIFFVGVVANPAEPLDRVRFDFSLVIPQRAFPWERGDGGGRGGL
jgi:hypothetical protein